MGLSRGKLESPYLEYSKKKGIFPNLVSDGKDDETPAFNGLAEAMGEFESNDPMLAVFEDNAEDEYGHVSSRKQKLFRAWDFLPESLLELELSVDTSEDAL